MSSFRDALKVVKADIQVVPAKVVHTKRVVKATKPVVPAKPKQYVNGYEVSWEPQEGSNTKVPTLQTKQFFIQYPTANEDIKLPEGTVRVTYNKNNNQVEFYAKGKETPIKVFNDSKHEPLPIPAYMRELESVEEIFDIDMETGEITSEMKIEVLPEQFHWQIRLDEFRKTQLAKNVPLKTIGFRINKYLKNLENQRGITVDMINQPLPQEIKDAIHYAQAKQLSIQMGGK